MIIATDTPLPEPVQMLAKGICSAGVCTSLPMDETLDIINLRHPTGISSPWALSDDPEFATGETNGCPCEDHPSTHRHYLLEC